VTHPPRATRPSALRRAPVRALISALALAAIAATITACSSRPAPPPPPGEREHQQLMRAARVTASEGRADQAARLYERALDAALLHDNRQGAIHASIGAAGTLARTGDWEGATIAADRARSLLRGDDDPLAIDVAVLDARLALRQNKLDEAAQRLSPARAAAAPSSHQRVALELTAGHIAAAQRDSAALTAAIDALRSVDAAHRSREELADLEARAALLAGDTEQAAELFERRANALRSSGDVYAMSQSLLEAAAALALVPDHAGAADTFLRAARSLARQRLFDQAEAALDDAAQSAMKSGSSSLERQVQLERERLAQLRR
jgi:hypothetical protein